MIKSYTSTICAALLLFVSCGAPADKNEKQIADTESNAKNNNAIPLVDGKYGIDTANSIVNWRGTEITEKFHVGTVNIYKGTIEVTDRSFKGTIAVDMESIQCTDENMLSGSKENLVRHLKSDDFFGVEDFPLARIKISDGKIDETNAHAYGVITVRDISHPIEFPLSLSMENDRLIADARLKFNRADHNVTFRSGAFPELFPDLGDKLINDEIELEVHIEAVTKPS
jgi:polyisoprenoid-binding protein YceI